MKYTDFQLIWRFESMIFKAKHFFRERSLHKFRGTFIKLGHAGRKSILMIFCTVLTKNGISLQEHDFSKFVYFSDNLKNGVKQFVPLKFAQILKANI